MFNTKGLVLAAAALAAFAYSNRASALTDERLPGSTLSLSQAGSSVTVQGRREAPRRGEIEIHGTVTRAGRDVRIWTGGATIRVLASSRVPVYYGGRVYRPADLEVGDRVVVIGEQQRRGFDVRRIEVVSNVSSRAPRKGTVSGIITSIDHRRETFRLRSQTGQVVMIDAERADARGRSDVPLRELRAGDRVTVLGHLRRSNVFVAESIRIPGMHSGRDDHEDWRRGRNGRY